MKCTRNIIEWLVIIPIFVVFVIEIISWVLCYTLPPAIITDYGGQYLIMWYPLLVTICLLFLAFGKLAMAFITKACIYTKITCIAFICYELLMLVYVLFPFDSNIYLILSIIVIFIWGIVNICTIFIKLIKK